LTISLLTLTNFIRIGERGTGNEDDLVAGKKAVPQGDKTWTFLPIVSEDYHRLISLHAVHERASGELKVPIVLAKNLFAL
jgi:hypothetical protein